MSFQISIPPDRAEAAFFVSDVRRALQEALVNAAARGINQSSIAKAIGVNRSVINRELRGQNDLMLGRVGQIAWAMGMIPMFTLVPAATVDGSNIAAPFTATIETTQKSAAEPSTGLVVAVGQ
jgi:DNA-binding phage protein